MKRSTATLLTALLLSAAIFPIVTQAQANDVAQTSFNPYLANQPASNPLSPFNLAYLAYRGYLKDQGIPNSDGLVNALQSKTVTAQDVMQAAVNANRLPKETLSDQGYRSALEDLLQGFTTD
jgi:hypothetical protein